MQRPKRSTSRRPKIARFKCRNNSCRQILQVACPDGRAYEDAYARNRANPWYCIEHQLKGS